MKSVDYINGHMKGKTFIAAEDDEETHAVYYHEWCGKLESILYKIVEDIAITDTVEYPDFYCENCRQIRKFKESQPDRHVCNCLYCGYWNYNS